MRFATGYQIAFSALAHLEEKDVRVSIRPEEFIRSETGDIVATIKDSTYLGLNTEYIMETPFAARVQVTEESTLDEDLGAGDQVRLAINTQKINVFTADGMVNLLEVE